VPPAAGGGAGEVLPVDALLSERWTGDLDGMRQRRRIRALVVYSKTFYFLDGAQQRGLSHEALKLFETFVNERFKSGHLRTEVVFIPVARDELIPGLLEGRGDLAVANLTITPERQAQVDFSTPVLSDVQEVVVGGPAAPPLARLEDLAGREVWVRRSSSYHDSLERLSARLRQAGRPAIRLRAADENLEDEDLLEMVNAGLIGLTVVDRHKIDFWATIFRQLRVHRELVVRSGGAVGWAFRKQSPGLKEVVDAFAGRHREGDATRNILLRRYLRDNKWVRNATAQEELRKFRGTVALFRKYADRYDFDYLMVAAQAYQESRLEQQLRSPAGAVGVMQIKPSTAAGQPIGVTGVERLEPNIHAGVKYLRFIVDRYYANAPMDRVNKGLFAFAAYNAGPARVEGLRRKAAAAGLDANRWFGHVERIAAREIGRETVQYVANIYKYYIAYTLVVEREQARRGARQARPAPPGGAAGGSRARP
jgi:membrane-bound lytic murein transglycosylase MltF